MAYHSPLRYPGGKGKLSGYFESLVSANGLDGGTYVEPFAGGAGVATSLLAGGKVSKIVLNDADRSIYALWYSVKHYGNELIEAIDSINVNIDEWKKQREFQRNKENEDIFDLGFSTLYMNRTNRSGILNGGVIGGLDQKGKYKIDARFNKKALKARIAALSKLSDSIEVSCKDASKFLAEDLNEYDKDATLVYIDPPYFDKGSSLYMNHYSAEDHEDLAKVILGLRHKWVLSYDDVPEIVKIYGDIVPQRFTLKYSSYERKIGKELFFFSDNLNSDLCGCNSKAVTGLDSGDSICIE